MHGGSSEGAVDEGEGGLGRVVEGEINGASDGAVATFHFDFVWVAVGKFSWLMI